MNNYAAVGWAALWLAACAPLTPSPAPTATHRPPLQPPATSTLALTPTATPILTQIAEPLVRANMIVFEGWSPDGQTIVLLDDEAVTFARLPDFTLLSRCMAQDVRPELVSWSPDGRQLAVVGQDRVGGDSVLYFCQPPGAIP